MGIPAERLNTGDAVMAEVKPGSSSFEPDWTCDYCHVQLRAIKQMTLNEQPHEVRQCPNDPAHVKTVLA